MTNKTFKTILTKTARRKDRACIECQLFVLRKWLKKSAWKWLTISCIFRLRYMFFLLPARQFTMCFDMCIGETQCWPKIMWSLILLSITRFEWKSGWARLVNAIISPSLNTFRMDGDESPHHRSSLIRDQAHQPAIISFDGHYTRLAS